MVTLIFMCLLLSSHIYFHSQQNAKSFILWGVEYECLLPIAARPFKAMEQHVRFRVPVDTESAVLHLLSAGKEESGADELTQSAVMVSNDAVVLLW